MGKTCLILIDPQYDFCDPINGQLYVNGAEWDMSRLAHMIQKMGSKINQIHVSIDSHFLISVAHSAMWRNKEGQHPDNYTVITHQDLIDKKWIPIYPEYEQWFLYYTSELEKNKKYELRIWPPHCLIGSIGQSVDPSLDKALRIWQETVLQNIHFISKGSSPLTEHYSMFKAEVPYPGDISTHLNKRLLNDLESNDTILVGGEALLHCVKNSLVDMLNGFDHKTSAKKVILLEDTTHAVPLPDYEKLSKEFIEEMKGRGVQIASVIDFI